MAVNRENIEITVDGAAKAERELDGVGGAFDGLAKSIAGAAAGFLTFQSAFKAAELAQAGARIQQVDQAFAALGGTTEQVEAAFRGLGGTVDRQTIKQLANTAKALGISTDQFAKLTSVATAAAKTLGKDVTEALQDVITGVARQSKPILDNVGILVSVEQANAKYAAALGKTAASLTDAEKQQAFFNAVLEAGAPVIEQVGAGMDGAAADFARLATSLTEAKNALSVLLAELLSPAAREAADVLSFLYGGGRSDERGSEAQVRRNLQAVNKEIAELGARVGPIMRARARGETGGVLSDLLGSEASNDAAIARFKSLKREAADLSRELERLRTIRATKFAGPLPATTPGTVTATTTRRRRAGGRDPALEAQRANLALLSQLEDESLRSAVGAVFDKMGATAAAGPSPLAARVDDLRDAIAFEREYQDGQLATIGLISTQAAAFARLGNEVDENGVKMRDFADVMQVQALGAVGAVGDAFGQAAVAALFAGESFSTALGNALIAAGAQTIGQAISGLAIAGILAFIPGLQGNAAGLAAASAAALGAGTALVGVGKALGGNLDPGVAGGPSGAGAPGANQQAAERDRQRDFRRSRTGADQQEMVIVINNSIGGERVDRQIHRAAVRGRQFDRPRRAGAA